jgi:hypothetical protein
MTCEKKMVRRMIEEYSPTPVLLLVVREQGNGKGFHRIAKAL